MYSRVAAAIAFSTITGLAHAEEAVSLPELRPGDKWVVQGSDKLVRVNEERSWKVRREVTKVEGILATWKYEMLPPSSPASGENQFDISAQTMTRGIVSGKPEATRFPLVVGKEWKYESEVKAGADVVRSVMAAKVAGWEEITVPAGTFRAIRIEHRGTWSRKTDHSRDGIMTEMQAPLEITYWYAPAAKAMAKILRIQTSAYGGIWSRVEEQLVEVSVGGN